MMVIEIAMIYDCVHHHNHNNSCRKQQGSELLKVYEGSLVEEFIRINWNLLGIWIQFYNGICS